MRDPVLVEFDEKVQSTLSLLAMNAGLTLEEFVAKLAIDRATNPEPDVAELLGFGAEDRQTLGSTADGVSRLTQQVDGLSKKVDEINGKIGNVAKTLASMPTLPASIPASDPLGRQATDAPALRQFALHGSPNAAVSPATRPPATPAASTAAPVNPTNPADPKARFKAWRKGIIL